MAEITRLLVANRGEIARRVIRTAHALGIETVAVFSEPDRGLPFVDEATYAVALGGATSAETYLDVVKVLDAARRTAADAVHPGYGFLAESAELAEAVLAAGLVWVGPTPESMRAMALKVEAKRIAAAAGVPLVPGAELGADLGADDLVAMADAVGYPVLVKASAGGGGKGMRVVRSASDLVEAVEGARREALSSFGDPTVFLERYVESARHVEVQVFGDTHGSVVHLFERECSVQRRHQKVLEESPSPGATPATLVAMHAAAVSLARAIGYVGAGTVEFLVSGTGEAQEFFFLEMNTRLQVEHPVTELVTGLDLVEWQLLVAQGGALPLQQHEIERFGHAIEVRLYAEDPARGYLPSTGRITRWDLAEHGDVRVDAAVREGSEVSPYYDPMLAKLVAHAATRDEAADSLARFLRESPVGGVTTNADLLVAVLESPAYREGATTTAFLDEHPELLVARPDDDVLHRHLVAAACALLGGDDRDAAPAAVPLGGDRRAAVPSAAPLGGRHVADAPDRSRDSAPLGWRNVAAAPDRSRDSAPLGWRNVAAAPELLLLRYRAGGDEHVAQVARAWARSGAVLWTCPSVGAEVAPAQTVPDDPRFVRVTGARLDQPAGSDVARLEVDGVRRDVRLVRRPDGLDVTCDGWTTAFTVVEPWSGAGHDTAGHGPTTPVPGTVTHVAVVVGQQVEAGQALVVLEAMKMEHTIRADVDGVVSELHVSLGQPVDAHTVVATIEPQP